MRTFIKKMGNYSFTCTKRAEDVKKKTGKETMFPENLYSHLCLKAHKRNTPDNELDKLKELKKLIMEFQVLKDLKILKSLISLGSYLWLLHKGFLILKSLKLENAFKILHKRRN